MVVASATVMAGALIIVGSRLASADGPNITTLNTAVFDASTSAAWSGTEMTGASAYDTSSVGGLVSGMVPTGTVTYTLFTDSGCTTSPTTDQVTLDSGGNVPVSSATAPLAAGSYSYQATYSGDSFYSQSTSGCEPFTVLAANSTINTTVDDAFTKGPWDGTEQTGASAYDTAVVGGVAGFAPTGSVTYDFFADSTCSGSPPTPQQVTLDNAGNVPNSSATGPLVVGAYSYMATYGGDSNYAASGPGSCEPFGVAKGSVTINSAVDDAATQSPWAGTEHPGAAAYDTSTVTGASGVTPTGTVNYNFFGNSTCSGTPASETVTISGGIVPSSSTTSRLAAGSYSYMVTYSGDSNYSGSSGLCEIFSVGMASATVSTEVDDPALSAAWNGHEVIGSSAYDTATVTGVGGFTPTGTISYTFWTNGNCSGNGSDAGSVLSLGSPSSTEANLGGGSYSFEAAYSGDSNYSSSTSGCELFTVLAASTTISTTVDDALTNSPWGTTEKTGATAYDTAVVGGGVAGFTPTGAVTYTLFLNGTCSGTPSTNEIVTLTGGTVPNSSSTTPLGGGSYSFRGAYSGDSNYASSGPSSCEPFTVGQVSSSIATSVDDALTNGTWTTTETTGTSAYDTSTVTGVSGVTPTGSVTYTFFMNNDCSGSPAATTSVNLSGGSVPNSSPTASLGAGSYSFLATYSGDASYAGSTSSCEPFSVVKATSTITTKVFDAATSAAWSGSELAGSSAYDTAAVGAVTGFTPTGAVTYDFFMNGACSGTGLPETVSLVGGGIPNSSNTAPLASGSYSYQATFGGDGNYAESTGLCETFSVGMSPATVHTTVDDAATKGTWSGSEPTGASAYDTSTVAGVAGVTPTGTVTYNFFANNSCSGTPLDQTVTISSGIVPNSSPSQLLAAGSYSYQAVYSGDNNYMGSPGPCETFNVVKATSKTATTVFDAGTSTAWSGSEQTGASAYDTGAVSGVAGFTPTGTVVYNLFINGLCSGTPTAQTVSISGGNVPTSSDTSALAAASYSYVAVYSGDSNYLGSTGSCEPFSVAKATISATTTVFDTTTKAAWSGTEQPGSSAYDTAAVSGVAGFTPTGSVTYKFFTNNTCSGSPATTQTVTISGGSVPNSSTTAQFGAGAYSFDAGYGGDTNYSTSTSSCEPFSVVKASPTISTLASPQVATAGTQLTVMDTATLGGAPSPTGSVTFTLYSDGNCTVAVSGVSGSGIVSSSAASYSVAWTPPAAGTYFWKAIYSGDGNNNSAKSGCGGASEQIAVGKASPTISTLASPQTGTVGVAITPVKDSATLSGGVVPTGSVTFTLYSNATCTTAVTGVSGGGTITSSAASYSVTWTPPAVGTYYWKATYAGDANNNNAVTGCGGVNEQITINKATPAIGTVASPTTGTVGVTILTLKDTATLSGTAIAPTGSVTFTLYSNSTCTTAVTGVGGSGVIGGSSASFSVKWKPAAAGTYFWIASYPGDANNVAVLTVCGSESVVVTAQPTISTTANPKSAGTGATLQDTATLANTSNLLGTGSVTFSLFGPGDTSCKTALHTETKPAIKTNGPFSTTTGFVAKTNGTYQWTASFSGDANNATVSSKCGSDPVPVGPQVSRITPSATTCAQFASGFATGLSTMQYTLSGTKVSTVTPPTFTYWVKVTSGGTLTITQSTSETSKKLLLAGGSAVYDNATASSCTTVTSTITQKSTSGTVTVKFSSKTGPFYIGLVFSTSKVVGETAPTPSTTVQYFFDAGFGGGASEIDLKFV